MPKHMVAEVIAMFERSGAGAKEVGPEPRPARHLVHVGDGVDAPSIAGRALERAMAEPLRLLVGAGLLECKGKAAEQIAKMRMIESGASNDALDRFAHAAGIAQHEAQSMREFGGKAIAWVVVENGFERCYGANERALRRVS